jgi:putative nucleotidyltransferase with HDIG domain
LEQKGARRETMVACLAGGALVNPLSQHDLQLDIGGRTTEKVRELLEVEKIEIERSETGGFFTCCLSLNMKDGTFSIEPAGYPPPMEDIEIRTPSPAEIKKAMDQLKPIPQVALKVMRMMDESEDDIEAVANVIRKDQVITARVLKLANSSLFGSKCNIDSLDHALVYLGRDLLFKVVIAAAVQSYFGQVGMGYSLCKGGLYYHAVSCAQVAEAIALKTQKVPPDKAYTAGLLHDIGKVVLDQYVAAVFPLFYRNLIEEGENIISTEQRLLGISHTDVGYLLGRQWAFPEGLAQAIRYHHFPEKTGASKDLALVVYMADLLLSRFNIGLEIERMNTQSLSERIQALDLEHADLIQLVDVIPQNVFAIGYNEPLSLF